MRSYWKFLIPIAAVAVLATALAMRVCSAPRTSGRVAGTYANGTFGYGLSYPAGIETRSDVKERVVFVRDGSPVAEARTVFVAGRQGESFAQAAETNRAQLCQAAGFPCGEAQDIRPFAGRGAEGYSFLLPAADGSRTLGPLYAFVLRSSATASSVLVVMPPLEGGGDAGVVRAIAESAARSDKK